MITHDENSIADNENMVSLHEDEKRPASKKLRVSVSYSNFFKPIGHK
jgi:hypothetical protein